MTPQSTIAHYRITAKLGEGGMGAVYRATDTKLNRDVAVKVLPDSFAADPDRLSRFTREAQVLASLNHPNIAAIYGVEERALILELVEGPTLAERIATGPIPVEEAIPIARQIAEALEYAHDRGIIHRDLKPANVKVTPEGRVKVLDFGLAKALAADLLSGDPAASPTLTMRATMAGMIMGTAGYMSPEQAKGKPVDRRADIWAFGVVLVEMLTGRMMYTGETVSETLASVIKDQPDLGGLPAETPPAVRRMIRRCLDKDPLRRLQAIGEARIAFDEPPEEPVAPAAGSVASVPAKRSVAPWAAAGVLGVVAMVALGFLWLATRPVDRPLQRFSVDLGPDALPGTRMSGAISPDGTRIAYLVRSASSVVMLATRLLDQSRSTILSGTENPFDPFFSPDGQWIGFYAEQKLKKISAQGGAAVTLCEASAIRGAFWGDDGNIYADLDAQHLFRVSAAGGKPQELVNIAASSEHAGHAHRWPQPLPGGESLLVTGGSAGATAGYDDANIEVLNLKTGQFQVVQRGGYFGRYLPSGHLIYLHQGTLFAVPFDAARLTVRGMPAPVVEEVAGNATSGGGQLDFSRTGTLIYLSGRSVLDALPLSWLDAAGTKKALWSAPPARVFSPRLSPDGTKLAGAINADISIYDPARGTALRVTFTPTAGNGNPIWAPDGKHLVYSQGTGGIWWVRSDGSGQGQLLYELKDGSAIPWSFTPDGRRLAFHQAGANTARDIYTLPLDLTDADSPKAGKPELFLATPSIDVEPMFSPDGKWMAYSSTESGLFQVYVRPFPPRANGGKWQISTTVGRFPIWSRSSKELFYTTNNHVMVVTYSVNGDTFSPGPPRQWTETPIVLAGNAQPLDLAPDGKRILTTFARESSSGSGPTNLHLTFLLNFFDELKRRLP